MSSPSVGVLGPCVCGGSSREQNYECERCRLVYAVRLAGEVRAAQRAYFETRQQTLLVRSKELESKLDRVLERMLVDPARFDSWPDH